MAVNEREELEELRRLDELERKAAAQPVLAAPTAQAKTPTKTLPTEAAPVAPTIPAQPEQSLFTPRLGLNDLMGQTGQNMLAGGLAAGALTPGPLPLKIMGGIAGAGAAYLGEEGTRRLQENLGEIPGYIAGLAASLVTGGAIGMPGRTPSHPTQFKNVTIESPETKPSIPAIEGLFETVPQGGGYRSSELLTEPSTRISPEHQFSTGSGESLFGQGMVDLPQHVSPPMAEVPRMPATYSKNLPPFQEKYPTIEQKIIPSGEHPTGLYKPGREPEVAPKVKPTAGIDTGSIGASGEYIPPKDYVEPPTPGKWAQMWAAEKQRWGQELPVLKTHEGSPVITNIESLHVYAEDYMENLTKQPWVKTLMKYGDNTKLAPLEKQWIADYKAGRQPSNMPDDFKQMFARMDALLDEENTIRRSRGLAEISKVDGPYIPRMTDEDFHLMRTLQNGETGAKTSQSIGSFGQARTLETLAEGMTKGVTYKDWRHALLFRESRSAVLRATDKMMTDLEGQGVLFRTKEAAEAASLTGKAFSSDGLPFAPKGGQWWVRSAEERQFLLQNLRSAGDGALNTLRAWGQQWVRNPSLVNPLPHIIKNMGLKQMQQAIVGGLNPAKVIKNSLAYRQAQLVEQSKHTSALDPRLPFRKSAELLYPKGADMIDEFKAVMPFTESGNTLWEIMESAGPKTMIQQMSRGVGQLNALSRQKIFAEWDPAMRYGLWREYVRKGHSPQEAANHAWIDLVRYGTKADRIDFWSSVPFNFFVPWRVGTLRTMNKALQSSPVRFAAFMGAVDTIREMDYRYNNRWTHLPYDYMERPIMTLIKDGKEEALTTLGATLIAGPGGEYMFRTIRNILNNLEGKGQLGDLKTLAWGIAQVYDLWPQYEAYMKDGKAEHITDMLGLVMLGRHATPYGAPRRFGELIPEGLIRKHPGVVQGEALRDSFKQHSDAKSAVKFQRDLHKAKQPWEIAQ